MRSSCPDSIERKIWPYIDRELSAREVAEISLHLKSCERCNRVYEQRAREAQLYRLAFVESPFGEDFARRFQEDFTSSLEEAPARVSAGEIFTFNPSLHHRRLAVGLSIAAMLLVVGLGVFLGEWGDGEPSPRRQGIRSGAAPAASKSLSLGYFQSSVDTEENIAVEPNPSRDEGLAELLAGFTYSGRSSPDGVELTLWDDSRLSFGGRDTWRFRVENDTRPGGDFRGHLLEGRIRAEVRPLEEGRRFVIDAPLCEVEVVGTVFQLETYIRDQQRITELEVEEGTVQLRYDAADGSGRRTVEVSEGDRETLSGFLAGSPETSASPGGRDPEGATDSGDPAGSSRIRRPGLLDRPVGPGTGTQKEEETP